ncbi:RING-H2 finger protein ATL46-like [Rutidosis leptorrhynchoides]|uniref:RING-H2 finger protein ATL46-like n=1 Tax=Rutidosis leptorrhynchoides TaxID=125765 RepID=UPI003A99545C
MGRILSENSQENGPSEITISPVLLWFIVSVAAIFFIFGILHVFLKLFTENQSYHPSTSQSNRDSELSRPQSLGRQLQQLFRQQDSGLDQATIDRLPVFEYKQITSLKFPFDCAVCLCEFLPHDQLRLIPICRHALHTQCIDTWLLSNSTCSLCRVNVGIESPSCNGPSENAINVTTNSADRVFSVRLGKFKSFNEGERSNAAGEIGSRCYLDARRCFSMGSFQYVVDNNIDLQVALSNTSSSSIKENVECEDNNNNNKDERKIKYESFSVSKIWLWSKKTRFQSSLSEAEVGCVSSSQNTVLATL